jgi:predicted DNA-binding transcriptional regulator YafY
MARGDQLARQWRIIQTLVTSKHGKTVADLVRDENCHPRTIYRDLEGSLVGPSQYTEITKKEFYFGGKNRT